MFPRILMLSILLTLASSAIALSSGWERTSGPGGGDITAIAASNLTGYSYVFAGTNGAGIFRSNPNGDMWSASNSGLDRRTINCILIGEDYVLAGAMGDIYRSVDSGASWQSVAPAGYPDQSYLDLAAAGDLLYAVVWNGVFRSSDDGVSWLRVDSSGFLPKCIAVDPYDNSILYVGTDGNGVYRSTDSGATWIPRGTGLGSGLIADLVFQETYLIAANGYYGVYRSSDGGLSWEDWDFGLPTPFNGRVISLAASHYRVFAGTSAAKVYAETTGSIGWAQVGDTLGNTMQTSVNVLCASGFRLYAGTKWGGVFRADNFDNPPLPLSDWTRINSGLSADETTTILEIGHGAGNYHSLLAGSANNGLFTCVEGDEAWEQPQSAPHSSTIWALGANDYTMFASVWTQGIYRGTGNPYDWQLVDSNWYVTDFCVSGSNILAGDINGFVNISTDNGWSWTRHNLGLPASDNINDLATSGTTTYLGTSYHGLYRSTDNGLLWSQYWDPPGPGKGVYSIAISGDDIFVLQNRKVYLNSDDGSSWILANSGLPDYVWGIFSSSSGLFACTPIGIYVSLNRGTNWTRINEGLDITDVRSVAEFNGYLYAATYGTGVWRRPLSEMSYMPGDADGNLMLNISDAVYLISYIFSGGPAPDPVLEGDANCDGVDNISDVVYMIVYIFSGGPQPGSECK